MRALIPRDLNERLINLRRDLHEHPELSFNEVRTSAALVRELEQFQPARIDRVGSTGIIARVAGRNRQAPVVAVRGDIDALPIQEATGLSFASANSGVMHACGHDVHASWAVGAAALLAHGPAAGDVLIVLQPAEETGEGALAMLESGLLDEAKVIFGAHVDRRFTVGQVVAQEGPLAASADVFDIELTGRGAHGARPHESADPIVCLAAIISSLQTVVSRRVNPATPAVVTVGMVSAGTAPNIIPARALLRGTLRATDNATRELLRSEVHHIAQAIGAAHHVEVLCSFAGGVPAVVNDASSALWAADAATSVVGAENVVPLGTPNMAAEDFAWYQQRMAGCFMRVGARRDGDAIIAAHSPHFDVDEGAIAVGASVLAECARRASAALAQEAA